MNKKILAAVREKSKDLNSPDLKKRDAAREQEIQRLSWIILMDRKRRARF